MSAVRKLQRKKAQAMGQLGQATKQLADLNGFLQHLPEMVKRLEETSQVLDAVLTDMDTLSKEHEFTLYLLRQTTSLTSEQEAQYRAKWAKERECPPES
jgi:DNA repair ATPase RecN